MYWDIGKTLSYNCLFNFVVGNRGAGKTYGAKKWAITDFLKNGNEFLYVRRYKQELKRVNQFFDDITGEFPEHEMRVGKAGEFFIDDEYAGRTLALSTSKIEKSTPFPRVNKIIFDEFILDKGVYHYLPDEVTNFLELYETVARMRDVKALFLSNAITIANPYFLYFDVNLPYGSNITRKGDILIELVQNRDFIEAKSQTRFAKIIEGTRYAEYAIENQFLRDESTFIQKKTAEAEYQFTFKHKGETFGVYVDYNAGLMFVSNNVDPSCRIIYSTSVDDHSPNTMLLKSRKSVIFGNFLKQFSLGNVRFENQKIKGVCREIFAWSL